MNPLTALLVFAGIPLAFALIVWTLLSVKSWSRPSGLGEPVEGPFLVTTGAALTDPSRLPRELDSASRTLAGGGARGRW